MDRNSKEKDKGDGDSANKPKNLISNTGSGSGYKYKCECEYCDDACVCGKEKINSSWSWNLRSKSKSKPGLITQRKTKKDGKETCWKGKCKCNCNCKCDVDVEEKTEKRKLVLVGDSKCGKTCLVKAWMNCGPCREIHEPTVFDNYSAIVNLKTGRSRSSHKVRLDLWDTAGLDTYDGLRPYSFQNAHAIILCFAVDSPTSFTNVIRRWHPQLCHYCPTVPIVLVGVKHGQGQGQDQLSSPFLSIITMRPHTPPHFSSSKSKNKNDNGEKVVDTDADADAPDLEIEIDLTQATSSTSAASVAFSILGDGKAVEHLEQGDLDTGTIKKKKPKSETNTQSASNTNKDNERPKTGACGNQLQRQDIFGGQRKAMLSWGQGQALATIIHAASYIECSPTTNTGVNQVFTRAANLAFKYGKGKGDDKKNQDEIRTPKKTRNNMNINNNSNSKRDNKCTIQ